MKLASLLIALGLAGATLRAAASFTGRPAEGPGEHTSYHASGEKEEWAEYLDGERHGACRRWYSDGRLRAEGRFEAGRMSGEWTWYTADGAIDRERSGRYEHGVRISD